MISIKNNYFLFSPLIIKMNLINKNLVNISFTDIFYLCCPLPKSINLLDKFNIIQYDGIRIPRIPSVKNNFLNIENFLYGSMLCDIFNQNKDDTNNNTIDTSNYKTDNKCFKKDGNFYRLINDKKYNVQLNNERYLFKNNNIIHNKKTLNNILKESDKNIDLIPPKKFSSIVNNNENNNFINIIDSINNYNINDINKIILNNINNIYNILSNQNIYSNIYLKNSIIIGNEINSYISNYSHYYFQNISNVETDLYSSSIINSKSNKISNQKILFKVSTSSISDKLENGKLLSSKRGRKKTKFKLNSKIHNAFDDDNIIRKIQVHFLSFITNYVNDIIRVFIISKNVPLFKNIDYKIKKNVKNIYVEELKTKTIGEIIQLRVSPKMKNHDDSINKNIYRQVCSLCPFMYLFLQRSYMSLFKEYFYNTNKIFIVNRKTIPLSMKTKTFNDLINKNYSYKEKLKYIAINYFLNNHKKYKK